MNKSYFADVTYSIGNKTRYRKVNEKCLVKNGYLYFLSGRIRKASECNAVISVVYLGIPPWVTDELMDKYAKVM